MAHEGDGGLKGGARRRIGGGERGEWGDGSVMWGFWRRGRRVGVVCGQRVSVYSY